MPTAFGADAMLDAVDSFLGSAAEDRAAIGKCATGAERGGPASNTDNPEGSYGGLSGLRGARDKTADAAVAAGLLAGTLRLALPEMAFKGVRLLFILSFSEKVDISQ
jgi:hypothetical protein